MRNTAESATTPNRPDSFVKLTASPRCRISRALLHSVRLVRFQEKSEIDELNIPCDQWFTEKLPTNTGETCNTVCRQ